MRYEPSVPSELSQFLLRMFVDSYQRDAKDIQDDTKACRTSIPSRSNLSGTQLKSTMAECLCLCLPPISRTCHPSSSPFRALSRFDIHHFYGVVILTRFPGLPPEPVQRSLTLIAKVIQSIANLNPVSTSHSLFGCLLNVLP